MSKVRTLVKDEIKVLDVSTNRKDNLVITCKFDGVFYEIIDKKHIFIVDCYINNVQGRRKEFKEFEEVIKYIKLEEL